MTKLTEDKSNDEETKEYLKTQNDIKNIKKIITQMREGGKRAHSRFVNIYISRAKANEAVRKQQIIKELMDEGRPEKEAKKIYEQYHKRGKDIFRQDAETLAAILGLNEIPDGVVVFRLVHKKEDGTYDLKLMDKKIRRFIEGRTPYEIFLRKELKRLEEG